MTNGYSIENNAGTMAAALETGRAAFRNQEFGNEQEANAAMLRMPAPQWAGFATLANGAAEVAGALGGPDAQAGLQAVQGLVRMGAAVGMLTHTISPVAACAIGLCV
jgi:hypothetical protein